jgi:hypothetical protein
MKISNDWFLDLGTINHMTFHCEWLITYEPLDLKKCLP